MNAINLSPKHSPRQAVTQRSSSSPKAVFCLPGKWRLMPVSAQLLFKQNTTAIILFWGGEKAAQLLSPNIKGGVMCRKPSSTWGEKVQKAPIRMGLVWIPLSGMERNQGHMVVWSNPGCWPWLDTSWSVSCTLQNYYLHMGLWANPH